MVSAHPTCSWTVAAQVVKRPEVPGTGALRGIHNKIRCTNQEIRSRKAYSEYLSLSLLCKKRENFGSPSRTFTGCAGSVPMGHENCVVNSESNGGLRVQLIQAARRGDPGIVRKLLRRARERNENTSHDDPTVSHRHAVIEGEVNEQNVEGCALPPSVTSVALHEGRLYELFASVG